jgi:demethylspheroidene O-methyltransferase
MTEVKPESTEDILELMEGWITSAALGAAMELGIFWLLAEESRSAAEVAKSLSIPLNRCQHWLRILCKLGLLEQIGDGYAPSSIARESILNVQSQEAWAFRAREERDVSLLVRNLPERIRKPMSAWEGWDGAPPGYFQRIQDDPDYAERFTRKLYEIHLSLADQLAEMIDLHGVKTLLDLGGGSGVVSFALLRKQQDLTTVVVDVENVCRAGRKIAAENELEDRVAYLAADFLVEELPTGFDMVLLCDVSSFSGNLFRRIHKVLNEGGRLFIVEKFAPSRKSPPPSRLYPVFLDSLLHPLEIIDFTTAEVVQSRLEQAGFGDFSIAHVPHSDNLPWNVDWVMLEARRRTQIRR